MYGVTIAACETASVGSPGAVRVTPATKTTSETAAAVANNASPTRNSVGLDPAGR